VFREDWSFAAGEALSPPPARPAAPDGRAIVAIVPSGPDQEHNANAMVYFAGIAAARERVWITTPYFIPDEPTLRALISAAHRGVDVRLLLPQRNDIRLVGIAARSYFPELVRNGVRVFQYRPSWLHAKAMAVDGTWALVGSANVDVRSFLLNFEVGALIVERAFAARLEEQFVRDLKLSDELTPATFAAQSFLARLRDGVARLLSPLL
jgi:cardiolipin synthase